MTCKKDTLKVNVVDSIMGSGKTTWVINKINQEENPKFIFVTPTLTEVERIKNSCPNANFKEPESKEHGTKYFNFRKLVCAGENIVTTHALFRFLTTEVLDELTKQQYTLIIDEALDCVEMYTEISKSDLKILLQDGLVKVEAGTYRLKWNDDEYGTYNGRFNHARTLCNNGNLVYYKEKTMLWEFPIEFLNVFKDIFVLSYLFQGSAMANYLKAEGTEISMFTVQDSPSQDLAPTLIPYNDLNEDEIKKTIRSLITIYEGRSNDIGKATGRENPLSSTWYKRATFEQVEAIRNGLNNFFNGKLKSKSEYNAWTTFKSYKNKLSGKGYAKGFLPNNLRATNIHIDKKTAAYTCNIFYHPVIRNYFNERDVTVYEDIYALSEMVQFLWRFQIRRHNPVDLYIPSERMRNLLKTWLESTTANALFNGLGYDLPSVKS
jgi:hypothetical protein